MPESNPLTTISLDPELFPVNRTPRDSFARRPSCSATSPPKAICQQIWRNLMGLKLERMLRIQLFVRISGNAEFQRTFI